MNVLAVGPKFLYVPLYLFLYLSRINARFQPRKGLDGACDTAPGIFFGVPLAEGTNVEVRQEDLCAKVCVVRDVRHHTRNAEVHIVFESQRLADSLLITEILLCDPFTDDRSTRLGQFICSRHKREIENAQVARVCEGKVFLESHGLSIM